ncbi:MAG TPA: hypothetical protein PLU72_15085 [Candidatus Ozemobacteraceae bacterium]|nr:hypothetical protein [Candidatus Ozemobacteraceae bacterium]HQG29323.1 hypothetical protein [Candidatus Ozemobacteraceae bacterium]
MENNTVNRFMWVIPVVFLILAWRMSGLKASRDICPEFGGVLDISEAVAAKADGTPPRLEMEYKYLIEGPAELLKKDEYLLGAMHRAVERELQNEFQWEVPKYVNASFSVCPIGLGTFCFVDIYVDTPDGINERWNIAHRIRYRWHSRGAFIRYMLGSERADDYPHRCEYQVKSSRDEQKDGFYTARETRFEYRNESLPFKRDKSSPPPPWPFHEYIPSAITGHYKNYFTTSAQEYARYIREVEPHREKLRLAPTVIEVMTRRRIHLNLNNPWGAATAVLGGGSTTNTTQAMVLTLDTVEVYPPDILRVYYVSREALKSGMYAQRLERRLRDEFRPASTYTEVEFEFERNIEAALHEQMRVATDSSEAGRLAAIETAFLKDQLRVSEIVRNALQELGLSATPINISKYRKARSILRGDLAWSAWGGKTGVATGPQP